MNEQIMQSLRKVDLRSLWHPFTQMKVWMEDGDPLVIDRGEGFELIDLQGNRYLDGVSSLWCNVHGHGVPELVEAIQLQASQLCHSTLLGLTHTPILELTRQLLTVVPQHLCRAFYSDSGSAAVEAGLRMVFEWWQKSGSDPRKQRDRFVALEGSYHGDTLGAVGVGYCEDFHLNIGSLILRATKIRPPQVFVFEQGVSEAQAEELSLQEARELFEQQGNRFAGLIIEPIVQGAAGIWVHSAHYLSELGVLAREHGVKIIVDEVATGFGKTGKLFAVEHSSVKPDVLILGKGLTGGYLPMSAALATSEIFDAFLGEPEQLKTFFYGQTFSGNPLAAAVANASIRLFESNRVLASFSQRAREFHRSLDEQIKPLPWVSAVRRCGMMVGIELTQRPGALIPFSANQRAGLRIVREARNLGLIIRPLGNAIVLMPAVSMPEPQLQTLVAKTKQAICSALG